MDAGVVRGVLSVICLILLTTFGVVEVTTSKGHRRLVGVVVLGFVLGVLGVFAAVQMGMGVDLAVSGILVMVLVTIAVISIILLETEEGRGRWVGFGGLALDTVALVVLIAGNLAGV